MIWKVTLAKLSPTMEEGTIVAWHKREGETVKVGDVLAEIETDKANMELEALGAGVLRRILTPAGTKAPVGALIGVVGEPDEDIEAVLREAQTSTPAAPAVAPPSTSSVTSPVAAPSTPAPTTTAGRVKASPLARAMAAVRNIPLGTIPGSGPGGRVIKRDVEGYATRATSLAPVMPTVAPSPATRPSGAVTEVPLSAMRRTIARRLSESFFSAPHFFVTLEIDMGPAVTLREQLARAGAPKVSFNDLVVKACARALVAVPAVNARWAEDKILLLGDVHLGIAVALPDGLVTPVVRNADRKPLLELAAEIRDLAARARERRLQPEDYTGSTFTVSNLGMLGVTQFTAIINPPESAILAVGAVRRVPVVDGEELRPGDRMNVTLSADHRVIDGALAAQFLQQLQRLLENPAALLLA